MTTRRIRPFLVACSAAAILGCSSSSSSSSTAEAAVTACTPGTDTDKPKATGQVTNGTSKRSTYFIRVEFRDGSGNKVTEGVDTISNVEPGTTSPWNITALADVEGPVDCRVETVRRSAAPGA